MLRRRRLVHITQRLFSHFAVNATCVMGGLRYRQIRRYVRGHDATTILFTPLSRTLATLSLQVPGKKTRTGIRRRMEALPYMVFIDFLSLGYFFVSTQNPDTDGNAVAADPLAALEKSTDAQNLLTTVQIPRLESLYNVSDHYNADPYTHSLKVRKRFREEKKIEATKKSADDKVKGRYALPDSLTLLADDGPAIEEAKKQWQNGRKELQLQESTKRRKLDSEIIVITTSKDSDRRSTPPPAKLSTPSPSSAERPAASLRARLLENAARQSNPFGISGRKLPGNNPVGITFKKS
jgi:hypothetical protein